MNRSLVVGALGLMALASVACGGGGSSSSTGAPSSAQSGTRAIGSATLLIPNASTSASAAKRTAQFISASSASVGVTVNGGTPTYSDVSATSPLCTATSNGRSCAIPLSAPGGNITFVFTLYDGPNGAGNVLGVGTVTEAVTIGTPYTVNVAVGGMVASLAVSVPVMEVGPTSVPVTVTAKDADGNTIIGAAPYPVPITLTNSDTTGALTLSTTSVTSPTTAVTLSYSGASLTAPVTIGATTSDVPNAKSSPASVLPLNYFPVNLSRTFSYTGSSINDIGPNPVPIGTAMPQPTVTPEPYTGTYTQSIVGGATFNGLSNLQQTTTIDVSSGAQPDINDISDSIFYRSIVNGTVSLVGETYTLAPFANTITYPNGYPYATLPFVTGATMTLPFVPSSSTPAAGSGFSSSSSVDSSGNVTGTNTSSDGSTEITSHTPAGAGTATFGPGTGTCGQPTNPYWINGLPCGITSAQMTVAAPANGVVTVNVSQTTGGSTQTASLTIPVSAIYPNGIPKAGVTQTVGAPLSAVPAPCAVTTPVQGPIVPVTSTSVNWGPLDATIDTYTEVDYLAPGVGIACSLYSYNEESAFLTSLATSTLPLQQPQYLYQFNGTETDSLTAVGTPTQGGTVIGTSRSRLPAAVMRSRLRGLIP